MGFISWAKGLFQTRSADVGTMLRQGGLGTFTDSGIAVNATNAMQIGTANACIRVISEDIAGFPWFTFERGDRGRLRSLDHPAYRLLHDEPNELMTAFCWRRAMVASALTFGMGYSKIVKVQERPDKLYLLPSKCVEPKLKQGKLTYTVRAPDGSSETLTPDQILVLPGLAFDGIKGKSVIEDAAAVFGIALAADKFAAKFYAQGASFPGYLKHPGTLSQDGGKRLMESWGSRHEGLDNAHRTPLLEEGMEFESIGIPPEQAQFLETRKYNALQICALFRVPPHKVMDLDRATFSNIEQQEISYVQDTLRSWIIPFEQECNRKLLLESEKGTIYTEMDVNARLRGDQLSRYQAYAIGRQWGWLTQNDILERENMPLAPDGDKYLAPLNMTPPSPAPAPSSNTQGARSWMPLEVINDTMCQQLAANSVKDEPTPTEGHETSTPRTSYKRLVEDASRRVVRKEINALRRATKKHDGEALLDWAEEFYGKHEAIVRQSYTPVVEASDPKNASLTLNNLVARHCMDGTEELAEAIESGTVAELLQRWEKRPQEIADQFVQGAI